MLEKLSFDKTLLAIFSQFRSSIFKIFLAPWPQPWWGLRVILNHTFSLCPPPPPQFWNTDYGGVCQCAFNRKLQFLCTVWGDEAFTETQANSPDKLISRLQHSIIQQNACCSFILCLFGRDQILTYKEWC